MSMQRTTSEEHITLDEYTFSICMVPGGKCFIGMLRMAKQQLDAMLSHYSKVCVASMTVHPEVETSEAAITVNPEVETSKNDAMSKFMRRLSKVVQGKPYNFERFAYAWFREAPSGGKPHYHLVLMMNGHKIRNVTNLGKQVICPEAKRFGLQVFIPKGCQGDMLTRGDQTLYDDCLYQLSYFSKVVGKEYQAKNSNNYSTTRVKHNHNQVWAGFKDTTG